MFSINPINSSPSPTFKFLKTRESNTQFLTWASLFSPQTQPLFTPSSSSTHFFHTPTKTLAKKMNSDAELAADLASEIEKLKTHLAKKEEAVKKSAEILFKEMCKYMEMQESEVMKKWKSMNGDEKLGLVNEFVAEWGVDFHPLSAKSVIEMVDMYLVEDVEDENGNVASDGDEASSTLSFSNLFKFLGLFQNE